MKKCILSALLALGLVAVGAPVQAAIISIDDYTTTAGDGVTAVRPAAGTGPTTFGPGRTNINPALVSSRTFTLAAVTGPNTLTASLRVAGGLLNFSNDAGVTSVGDVEYTGNINLTGFLGLEFDASNLSSGPIPFSYTLTDNAALTVTGSLLGGINANGSFFVPPNFVPPGFNFANVTEISISLDATAASGGDVSLDNLRVRTQDIIPEPTTLFCLGLGLASAAGYRALRRKKVAV